MGVEGREEECYSAGTCQNSDRAKRVLFFLRIAFSELIIIIISLGHFFAEIIVRGFEPLE
jgi:hypothetical protein